MGRGDHETIDGTQLMFMRNKSRLKTAQPVLPRHILLLQDGHLAQALIEANLNGQLAKLLEHPQVKLICFPSQLGKEPEYWGSQQHCQDSVKLLNKILGENKMTYALQRTQSAQLISAYSHLSDEQQTDLVEMMHQQMSSGSSNLICDWQTLLINPQQQNHPLARDFYRAVVTDSSFYKGWVSDQGDMQAPYRYLLLELGVRDAPPFELDSSALTAATDKLGTEFIGRKEANPPLAPTSWMFTNEVSTLLREQMGKAALEAKVEKIKQNGNLSTKQAQIQMLEQIYAAHNIEAPVQDASVNYRISVLVESLKYHYFVKQISTTKNSSIERFAEAVKNSCVPF